jgi:CubicO group peptidase (beta-lactamase class C family)
VRSGSDGGVDAGAMRVRAPLASVAFIAAVSISISAQTRLIAYPGTSWGHGDPQQMGWSTAKLEEAHAFVQTLPPSSVLIIDRGRVVAQWGNPSLRIKISSTRKSLLSALYGIYVANGTIDLNRTLEQLGIDDDPPLSMAERQATIRMLLEARSGVYHSYVAGTPSMRANLPARGSHAPGTFWYYNNWDFNALGTIFEQVTHSKIGLEFRDRIAKSIEMQDFRLTDMYYLRDREDAQPYEKSIHPAYHFRLSARDLARFGYLYLRQGLWNGTQLIPRNWIAESTRSYSDAGDGRGYGYLWQRVLNEVHSFVHGGSLQPRHRPVSRKRERPSSLEGVLPMSLDRCVTYVPGLYPLGA